MRAFIQRLQTGSILSRASAAGPNRLLVIGGTIGLIMMLAIVISLSGSVNSAKSMAGKLPPLDPDPGGLNSNPQQDKLALLHNQQLADEAARHGRSFTPPMAASEELKPPMPLQPQATSTTSSTSIDWSSHRARQTTARWAGAAPDPAIQTVSQTTQTDGPSDPAIEKAVDKLLRGWDGRAPRTEVIVQPVDHTKIDEEGGLAERRAFSARNSGGSAGALLMPAGRGVFAHTVLAVDSDSGGPVVLQADSGPLSGDRMIGTFSKAGANGGSAADRLVVRVNSIEHQGKSIATDAIVIAPDTMETTVASSVDEHYLSRFVLPAAAAFVQGLGQALATTSNTTGELNALGGQSYITHLNLPQQLGVGAGVAAGQVGNTLSQQAPHSPTIHLDANCDVGVMFLSPVRETAAE